MRCSRPHGWNWRIGADTAGRKRPAPGLIRRTAPRGMRHRRCGAASCRARRIADVSGDSAGQWRTADRPYEPIGTGESRSMTTTTRPLVRTLAALVMATSIAIGAVPGVSGSADACSVDHGPGLLRPHHAAVYTPHTHKQHPSRRSSTAQPSPGADAVPRISGQHGPRRTEAEPR